MQNGLVKDISFISAFIGHNFSEIIISYLDCNYIQCLTIITEITGDIYQELEGRVEELESIECLDEITRETKNYLWHNYGINLITQDAAIGTGNTTGD